VYQVDEILTKCFKSQKINIVSHKYLSVHHCPNLKLEMIFVSEADSLSRLAAVSVSDK